MALENLCVIFVMEQEPTKEKIARNVRRVGKSAHCVTGQVMMENRTS